LSGLRKDSLTAEGNLCEYLCSKAFFMDVYNKEVDKDLILPAKMHVGQAGFYQIRHM
jgi:hypothetical protein